MTAPLAEDAAFAEWFVEEVMKDHHPEFYFALSAEGKRERVIKGRKWARFYGLNEVQAQAYFVGMMWDIGPDFHFSPGFSDVLADRGSPELERVRRFLDGTVTDAQARKAIMNSDEMTWWRAPEKSDG